MNMEKAMTNMSIVMIRKRATITLMKREKSTQTVMENKRRNGIMRYQ